MNNEIKQGDKVKVSENAPKMYLSGANNLFKYHLCKVEETDGGSAKIRYTDIGIDRWLAIPTKYLVKVDTEAKEAEIKLGDKVRIKGNLHEPFCLDADLHLEITNIPPHAVSQKEWKVIKVENRRDCAEHIYTLNNGDSFIYNIPEDCVELVEPTEQTEEKTFDDQIRDVLNGVEHQDYGHPIQASMINLDINDWDAYAADLAKEVALKVANKKMDNHPEEIGAYAVSVAKAVVEGLKRK